MAYSWRLRRTFRQKKRPLLVGVAAVTIVAFALFSSCSEQAHSGRALLDAAEEVQQTTGGLLEMIDGPGCSDHMSFGLAVVVWSLGALYTFLGIAVVCDDFFVASLEAISEALDLSEDVAGATFMAAGSSAPELFTSVAGCFFVADTKNDNAGPGTIVGSAVFNIAVIIGASVLFAGQTLALDWWPLARDATMYTISIVLLLTVIKVITPNQIDWWEAVTLVCFYAIYICVMYFNGRIVVWLVRQGYRERQTGENIPDVDDTMEAPLDPPENQFSIELQELGEAAPRVKSPQRTSPLHRDGDDNFVNEAIGEDENDGEEDDEPSGPIDKVLAFFSWPWVQLFTYTIPDCSQDRWKKYYLLSFTTSIIWIGLITFLMVEFGIKIGRCFHLTTNVVGLTILAVGTSVPDALASIFVAKQGKGNMAVSNAIGSNVFDILLGLGLPWTISTLLVRRKPLEYESENFAINALALLCIIIVFLVLVLSSQSNLKVWHGAILVLCYPLYSIFSLLLDKGMI